LDPTKMQVGAARAELRCPACRALVPVRLYDAERGTWKVEAPAQQERARRHARRAVASSATAGKTPAPAVVPIRPAPTLTAINAVPKDAPVPVPIEPRADRPANHDAPKRPLVVRRPDYGNVVHVDCRNCSAPNLLDPARMENQVVRVFLLCARCGRRFLVRRADIDRPAPDAVVVALYTSASPEVPARRGRRS